MIFIPTGRFLILLICLLGIQANGRCASRQPDVYDIIAQRVHQDQLDQVKDIKELDGAVSSALKTLDALSGRWTDVDYADHKRINVSWLPVLDRMRKMTIAYTHPQSRFYKDTALWQSIQKSLFYFSSHKPLPYCDNWYQQGITRPQRLALSLLNMQFGEKPLDKEVVKVVLAAACIDTAVTSNGRNNPMHKYNFGANKSEIALGWVYLGVLLKDKNVLQTAVREAFAPIQFTTGEGIQYDYSYDMHYGYLYNGTYGLVFVNSVLRTANFVRDTEFDLPKDKLVLFRTFLKEGIFGVMRGKTMDWNVMGRGLSRKGVLHKDLDNELKLLSRTDTSAAPYYSHIRQRMQAKESLNLNEEPAHRHFWHTDFTVHTRPDYYFSIHAVSKRNHAQEIGNQENLRGYWGAQGTANLMVSGQEFKDIFPVWNWAKLPGTTLPDTVPIPADKAPGSGDRWGTSPFAGGLSDSLYGAAAYVVDHDLGTSYKKAWFMFDKEIVCLGAGIHSSLPGIPLSTTLNQAILAKSGIRLKEKGKPFRAAGSKPFVYQGHAAEVFLIGNVGYMLMGEHPVKLTVEDRTGSWQRIRGNGNDDGAGREERKTVFQLEITHGVQPLDATYAYMLLPGITEATYNTLYRKKNPVQLIANSADLQAVYHQPLKTGQAVFYKADQWCKMADVEIITDKPCILMLKAGTRGQYQLSAADPTQQLKTIRVTLKKSGQQRSLLLELPRSPYAGQTVQREVIF